MLTDRPIGEVLSPKQGSAMYPCRCAGVAWPGKEVGYAVVLGLARETVHHPYSAYVIDEYESGDIADLIRQCCVLDAKWSPDRWMGNRDNEAAQMILWQVVSKYALEHGNWRGLSICPPIYMEHKRPYEYMIPQIKDMLKLQVYGEIEIRKLYLKGCMAVPRLQTLDTQDLTEFKWGERPHIEALAFAALEIFALYENMTYRPPERQEPAHYMDC